MCMYTQSSLHAEGKMVEASPAKLRKKGRVGLEKTYNMILHQMRPYKYRKKSP